MSCRCDGPLEPIESSEEPTAAERNFWDLVRVSTTVERISKFTGTGDRPRRAPLAQLRTNTLVLVTLLAVLMFSDLPSGSGKAVAFQVIALWSPAAMTESPGDGLYVYDSLLHEVVLREPNGVMSVVAGNGNKGDTGNGGAATLAEIGDVVSLADSPNGTLYLSADGRVRAVIASGRISTVAGDGGPAQQAVPSGSKATEVAIGAAGIAVSPNGDLYVVLEASNQVMVLRRGRLYQVLGSQDFVGTDPLFPRDDQPGITTISVDDAGTLYMGGVDPYVVFAKAPGSAVRAIGLLRLNPPDALAAGPAGSVVDAGTLSAYRFREANHGADLYSEGELVSNYSLKGLLPGDQYLSDGGVAVMSNGTVVLDGDAFGAPGDCHHAVLVAVRHGQRRLVGNWQHYKTGPSC